MDVLWWVSCDLTSLDEKKQRALRTPLPTPAALAVGSGQVLSLSDSLTLSRSPMACVVADHVM